MLQRCTLVFRLNIACHVLNEVHSSRNFLENILMKFLDFSPDVSRELETIPDPFNLVCEIVKWVQVHWKTHHG